MARLANLEKKQTATNVLVALTFNEVRIYDVVKGSNEMSGNCKAVVLRHNLGRLQFAVKGRSKKSFLIKGQRATRPDWRCTRRTINVQAGNFKPRLHNNHPTSPNTLICSTHTITHGTIYSEMMRESAFSRGRNKKRKSAAVFHPPLFCISSIQGSELKMRSDVCTVGPDADP